MPENTPNQPVEVTPEQLEQWLARGEAMLIDVREGFEHAAERIPGARNIPLSGFDPDQVRSLCGPTRAVFHCRSGKRSADAAARFARPGEPTYHLAGGIEAWKASGRRTQRSASAPRIDVMRQVQIVAGALVLTGIVLGVLVTPWLLGLSAFVGAGLLFAGLTGWCGMAKLLARMPWNRTPAPPTAHRPACDRAA